MNKKTTIIIGAGPAGLTAAYELLDKSNIIPIVFEMTGDIGGISKTVVYKSRSEWPQETRELKSVTTNI